MEKKKKGKRFCGGTMVNLTCAWNFMSLLINYFKICFLFVCLFVF